MLSQDTKFKVIVIVLNEWMNKIYLPHFNLYQLSMFRYVTICIYHNLLMFLVVKFWSSSNVKVHCCQFFSVNFLSIFGCLDSVKWTSLILILKDYQNVKETKKFWFFTGGVKTKLKKYLFKKKCSILDSVLSLKITLF